MLLIQIHEMPFENGMEALAAYFYPRRRGKFFHLTPYEFKDQMGPIFGEYMRNKKATEAYETLKLKMNLFCRKE